MNIEEQNLNEPQNQQLNIGAVRHSILHESFLAAMELSASDRHCVVSFVRPFKYVDTHTATNICQYTFLNGYYFAAYGVKRLDNEFLEMAKSKFTRITGVKPNQETNRLEEFIQRKSIASDLFKRGMALYCANSLIRYNPSSLYDQITVLWMNNYKN